MYKEKARLPLIYSFITGAIGKQFVIKHYKYGTVKTKYPDMTRVVASNAQRKCRNLFKEAVAYAQSVLADPVKYEAWRKRTRKPRFRVFTQIVRYYMLEARRQKQQAKQKVVKLIRKCFSTDNRNDLANQDQMDARYKLNRLTNDHRLLERDQIYF